MNSDGSDFKADAIVGFINYPLHAVFSQVDVYLNEKLITVASNTYPSKANIEKLLCFNSRAKKTQFSSELYAKDTPGKNGCH